MSAKRMEKPKRPEKRKNTERPVRRAAIFLPVCLTVLILAAGFFASGAVGEFLPDYTERVFTGRQEQALQNAFYTGTGDELLVYPWDSYQASACTLLSQDPGLTGAQAEAARGIQSTLQNSGETISEIDWSSRIMLNSATGMNYLPETHVDATVIVSMAFDEGSICYYHLKHEGNRDDSFNGGDDELIQKELKKAQEWLSLEYTGEEFPQLEDGYDTSNPFIQFITGLSAMYGNVERYSGYYFYNQAYSIQQIRSIIQTADYTTLYREGETLISFSRRTNDRYTSSVVLYYDEFYHTISGFSAKV